MAEKNLDMFCANVDKYFKYEKGVSHPNLLIRNKFSGSRELYRTREWVGPAREEQKKLLLRPSVSGVTYVPFSALTLEGKPSPSGDLPPPKIKAKTRGTT